jgi:hypothetical protein
MTLQPDGQLLLAGAVTDPAGRPQDPALVRLLASAPQVGSFAAAPNTDGSTTVTAASISDGNPNATIAQVQFFYLDDGGNEVSLGNGTRNPDGTWTLTVNLPPGSDTLQAQATDSYGAVGDPTSLNLQLE